MAKSKPKLMKVNAAQLATIKRQGYDELWMNAKGVVLIRQSHIHGMYRILVARNGKDIGLGSGPVPVASGPWAQINEVVCAV